MGSSLRGNDGKKKGSHTVSVIGADYAKAPRKLVSRDLDAAPASMGPSFRWGDTENTA